MALLRVDNGMSEETDEVVRHDNKGVAGFGSPKVLGREFVGREVVLDFLDSVLPFSIYLSHVINNFKFSKQK